MDNALATNLLGKPVQFVGAQNYHKTGVIQNVYFDKDGNLIYTVSLDDDGELMEVYPRLFRLTSSAVGSDRAETRT